MRPTAQDIYFLIGDYRFKKVTEILHDGTTGMYVVLKILDDNKELSAGDVSEALGVTTARTAVILKTLEKKGLVKKTKSETDARKTIVKITNAGLLSLNERKQKIIGTIENYMSVLNDNDAKNFYDILQKLLNV